MLLDVGYTAGASPIQDGSGNPASSFSPIGGVEFVDPGNLEDTYYIDHLDHALIPFQTIRPENLDFNLLMRDVDTITYEISFGATDIYGAPIVSHDHIGARRTSWSLRCGAQIIASGIHSSVQTNLGDDFMSVAGISNEGYFNLRHFPYDARTTHVNDEVIGSPPQGLAYEVGPTSTADISNIVKAIFDAIFTKTYSYPIWYPRLDVGFSIDHYRVALGDFTTFLSMLQSLADYLPGFDFWVDPLDFRLLLASPYRFGDTAGIVSGGIGGANIAYAFYDADDHRPVSLAFTNIGPEKTHTVGTGAGTGTQVGVSLGAPGNESAFWRIDGTYAAGDEVMEESMVDQMTRQDFGYGLQPVHQIPMTITPESLNMVGSVFWATFLKGVAIWIQYDLFSHMINSPQRIVSIHGQVDQEGNMVVELGLNEIYYVDPTIGVYEG